MVHEVQGSSGRAGIFCLGAMWLWLWPVAAGIGAEKEHGLVLYLSFDEGAGTIAKDLSGNGNDGVLHGPEWVQGEFGTALEFDGLGDFVHVPFNEMFDIGDEITLAAWIQPDMPWEPESEDNSYKGIISSSTSPLGGPYQLLASDCVCATADGVVGEIAVAVSGFWWGRQTATKLTNSFLHLVGTYSRHNGGTMYINGKLDMGFTNMGKGAIEPTPGEGLFIGHNYGMEGRWWDGVIDEVVVYSRALSAEEVEDLYTGKVKARLTASRFQRGDVNGDGSLNITDPISTLAHLFQGASAPSCLDAADADDNGAIQITDAILTLSHLFLGGPALPEPFGSCGADGTADDLGCAGFPACR